MKEFLVEIITPSKAAFKGNVTSITVPGSLGEFQVLFNHAPLMSSFEIGKIHIKNLNDEETIFATSGGVVEVNHNKVLVLSDSVESIPSIDVDRAQKALDRAKERLANKNGELDVQRAEAALARAVNRLRLTNIN